MNTTRLKAMLAQHVHPKFIVSELSQCKLDSDSQRKFLECLFSACPARPQLSPQCQQNAQPETQLPTAQPSQRPSQVEDDCHLNSDIHASRLYYHYIVLRALILHIEYNSLEIDEEVTEYFGELLCETIKPYEQFNVNYRLNDSNVITVSERPFVIGQNGSTGQRSWEGALVLIDYLIRTCNLDFLEQEVLELGAGTGLVGLAIAKLYPDKSVILTDFADDVLENLSRNVNLSDMTHELADGQITIAKLDWTDFELIPSEETRLVVAADCLSEQGVDSLAQCISTLLKVPNCNRALLSAVLRNEQTINGFIQHCENLELSAKVIESLEAPLQSDRFYLSPMSPPILIIEVTR